MPIQFRASRGALTVLAAGGAIALTAAGFGARKPLQKKQSDADQSATYRLQAERNVVQVRVVVLDSHGKAVPGLTQNDFLLFDNGEQQAITGFSVEGGATGAAPSAASGSGGTLAAHPQAGLPAIPDHFVALYYDDLWMPFSNVVYSRDAAERFLKTDLNPDDRVGLFTSSGIGQVDFTADRQKLMQALAKLQPRSMQGPVDSECPPLSDFEAFLVNREDVPLSAPTITGPGRGGSNEFAVPSSAPEIPNAVSLAAQQVIQCACGGDPSHCPNPALQAKEAARMRWESAEYQIHVSLGSLNDLVDLMAHMPGRRTIVFISPGFVDMGDLPQLSEIIDRAVRNGVVINAIDSRGMWAQAPGGNADNNTRLLPPEYTAQLDRLQRTADEQESDVMTALAEGTGGSFFHDNNDFDQGFREAGGLPQFAYVLAFSPSKLKDNGAFHHLKVKLTNDAGRGLRVEARKGYYAPTKSTDAATRVAEEINQAVFSRQEMHGLPLRVETSFSRPVEGGAILTVSVHLGAEGLDFRRQGDRYVGRFTSVTGIFDADGNYLHGTEKTVDMTLTKSQFKQIQKDGLKLQLEFPVSPGNYLLRNVIRDSSGAMSAVNNEVRAAF